VCALKNVWEDFTNILQVGKSCDFWELYTGDKEVKAIDTLIMK
jgi:hypothetical protein